MVGVSDLFHIAKKPGQLERGRIRGERQATDLLEAIGARPCPEFPNHGLCASIRPSNGVVKSLAGLRVPDGGCFALVGQADSDEIVKAIALLQERACRLFDACLDR